MKNITKLLALGMAGLCFTACTEDYTDWAEPQHNDPEGAVVLPNITSQAAVASVNVSELDEAANISLVTFQGDVAEDIKMVDSYINLVPSGSTGVTPATIALDASGTTTVGKLNEAVLKVLGEDAESVPYDFDGAVYANLVVNGYATSVKTGDIKINVTPMAVPNVPAVGYIYDTAPVLYLTGSNYGWGGTWLPLVPVYGHPTMSWRIIYLHEGEEFKFAPQADWGNDFGAEATIIDNAGMNPSGGGNIVVGNAGWYLLIVDNTEGARTVTINKPEIYLIGNTFGSWDAANPDAVFTFPKDENGVFISPKFIADDEVRMHVSIPGADWWQSEFIGLETGEVDFRGNGGDQTRVKVKAGQRLYLNLNGGGALYK